jgi:hypothetical protein
MNNLIKRLYRNLRNSINDSEIALKYDSIYLTFSDKKQNELISQLARSCISLKTLTQTEIDSIDKELFYEFPEKKISLSSIGIFKYEENEGYINQEKLLRFFNEKWKNKVPSEAIDTNLSVKEKLVLSAMLASRAFSIDQCIDASKNDKTLDEWRALFVEVDDYLVQNNFNSHYDLIEKTNIGNEKTIHNMMRKVDKLPSKTNTITITKASKPYHYYLDVLTADGSVDKERLKFIINVVTEGNGEHLKNLDDFCNNIYNKYFARIYENTLFNNYDYSNDIKNISLQLLIES